LEYWHMGDTKTRFGKVTERSWNEEKRCEDIGIGENTGPAMMPNSVITIRAGRRAAARIRDAGMRPADFGIVPGAAGGPKGLGIAGLARAIFCDWLPSAPGVRHLVGSSIGAWRFAAACRSDAVAALQAFTEAYTQQRYPRRPSARFVSQAARAML